MANLLLCWVTLLTLNVGSFRMVLLPASVHPVQELVLTCGREIKRNAMAVVVGVVEQTLSLPSSRADPWEYCYVNLSLPSGIAGANGTLVSLKLLQLQLTAGGSKCAGDASMSFLYHKNGEEWRTENYCTKPTPRYFWISSQTTLVINWGNNTPNSTASAVFLAELTAAINLCDSAAEVFSINASQSVHVFVPDERSIGIPGSVTACTARSSYSLILRCAHAFVSLNIAVLAAPHKLEAPHNQSCGMLSVGSVCPKGNETFHFPAGTDVTLRYDTVSTSLRTAGFTLRIFGTSDIVAPASSSPSVAAGVSAAAAILLLALVAVVTIVILRKRRRMRGAVYHNSHTCHNPLSSRCPISPAGTSDRTDKAVRRLNELPPADVYANSDITDMPDPVVHSWHEVEMTENELYVTSA